MRAGLPLLLFLGVFRLVAHKAPQLADGEILAQLALVDLHADRLSQRPSQLDHILVVGVQIGQRNAALQITGVAAELLGQKLLLFFKGHVIVPLSLGSLCSYHTSPQRRRQGANGQQLNKIIAHDLWILPKRRQVIAAVRSKYA